MTVYKVLLDCNVLVDVGTHRTPFFAASKEVVNWCEQNPGSAFVAWHTVATLYYLFVGNAGDAAARQFIRDFLAFGEVVATGSAEVKHALSLPMPDFEDGLQAAAAVVAGVDYIITRNAVDFADSPVPAISPADFLALLRR